jgi:hypothetical protein
MTSKEFLLSQLKQNIGECRKLFKKVIEKDEEKKNDEDEVIKKLNKHIDENPNFEKEEPSDYKKIIENIIERKKQNFNNFFHSIN